MLLYLLRRLLLSIPLLFLVSILTFVVVALIPGDPAVRILGAGHTAAEYHVLDQKLGLTQPVLTQYWHWLDQALHGSLGTSLFSLQSVGSEVNQRLGATISLVIGGTLVSLLIGVPLGIA
ncbi:MAG: ABC transporter permease, partial [Solirubrobacteraceae bacterium]